MVFGACLTRALVTSQCGNLKASTTTLLNQTRRKLKASRGKESVCKAPDVPGEPCLCKKHQLDAFFVSPKNKR